MSRCAVEVEVVLLNILAVIAFTVGQAEQTLLQDRVLAIPKRQRKTELLWSSEMPPMPSSPQR